MSQDVSSAAPAIAVTGATGQVGSRVARLLAEAGAAQRLVVRDLSRAPRLPDAQVVTASYGDGPGMRRALDGIETLFLVSAAEAKDRLAQHLTAVDAAVAAGVRRIVYLSFLGADPRATFSLARQHWATEEHIRARVPSFTFLRDSLYADFLPSMAGPDRVIRGPAGNGVASVVTRDDIADVAAAVLFDTGHDGKTYDVTGPEALTMTQVAEELSRAAGQAVRFVNETLPEAYASRAHYGAPDWVVEGWVTSYMAIAAGELAPVSDTVRVVAGHDSMTFAEFLRRYPESYLHLR